MKVLHVITGLGNGGAEAVLYRLISADQQCGNKHYVVSLMDRGIYAAPLESAGVAVSTLNMLHGRVALSGLWELYKVIKQVQPEVVQTWMYHADLIGGVIARLAGVRAVVWGIRHANHDPAHNRHITLVIAKLCARLSGWVPAKIVSCSVKATQLHQTLGYSAERFVVIANGYALNTLTPDLQARRAVREALSIAPEVFVFGMVARYDPQKDHVNLLQALSQVKLAGHAFVCLLAGVGMDDGNAPLLKQIEAAGIAQQVRLLGQRNDIPALMNALDVHVLSSLGEAFPNVLAEAMACGTPCVSTDVGDAALIMGDHGWVVPAQYPAALAGALMHAKTCFENDHPSWQVRQQSCREHIMANFELGLMCERYRQVWRLCAKDMKN